MDVVFSVYNTGVYIVSILMVIVFASIIYKGAKSLIDIHNNTPQAGDVSSSTAYIFVILGSIAILGTLYYDYLTYTHKSFALSDFTFREINKLV